MSRLNTVRGVCGSEKGCRFVKCFSLSFMTLANRSVRQKQTNVQTESESRHADLRQFLALRKLPKFRGTKQHHEGWAESKTDSKCEKLHHSVR